MCLRGCSHRMHYCVWSLTHLYTWKMSFCVVSYCFVFLNFSTMNAAFSIIINCTLKVNSKPYAFTALLFAWWMEFCCTNASKTCKTSFLLLPNTVKYTVFTLSILKAGNWIGQDRQESTGSYQQVALIWSYLTHCVLRVKAALVMEVGRFRPLVISRHIFLLMTSTKPPFSVTSL